MKRYYADAWHTYSAPGPGVAATCRACSMHVIKYRLDGVLHYASWLGDNNIRDKDGREYTLPQGAEVVWIRNTEGM